MNYAVLITLHLFAAFIFVGTVFFEVLMLEGVRKHVPHEAMRQVEQAIGLRARRIMPWVLLVLYGAGISMAWHYRSVRAPPLDRICATGGFGVRESCSGNVNVALRFSASWTEGFHNSSGSSNARVGRLPRPPPAGRAVRP